MFDIDFVRQTKSIDTLTARKDIDQTIYKVIPMIISEYLVPDSALRCFVLVQS